HVDINSEACIQADRKDNKPYPNTHTHTEIHSPIHLGVEDDDLAEQVLFCHHPSVFNLNPLLHENTTVSLLGCFMNPFSMTGWKQSSFLTKSKVTFFYYITCRCINW